MLTDIRIHLEDAVGGLRFGGRICVWVFRSAIALVRLYLGHYAGITIGVGAGVEDQVVNPESSSETEQSIQSQCS